MTLREKAIQEAVRAITERRRRFQQKWVEMGMSHAALPEPPSELVARAAFDAILSVIMEPDGAMIEAGAVIALDEMDEPCPELAAETYQAMIRKLMGDRG